MLLELKRSLVTLLVFVLTISIWVGMYLNDRKHEEKIPITTNIVEKVREQIIYDIQHKSYNQQTPPSNQTGINMNGHDFYYQIQGKINNDPYALNKVDKNKIIIVDKFILDKNEIIIYTIE